MAVWQRKPGKEVIVHPDQGSRYGSYDWMRFCRDHKLQPGMSHRGNCYGNAQVESFFSILKKERIKIESTGQEKKAGQLSLIISRSSTTEAGIIARSGSQAPMNLKELVV